MAVVNTAATLQCTTKARTTNLYLNLKLKISGTETTFSITLPAEPFPYTWNIPLTGLTFTESWVAECPNNVCGSWLSMIGNATPPPTPPAPIGGYDQRNDRGLCTGDIAILNQGQCGSCYAHSASTASWLRVCKANGPSFGYQSPQNVLSCSSSIGGNGTPFTCNGGYPEYVVDWMAANGALNTCCDPYNQANGGNIIGTCPLSSKTCSKPLTSSGGSSGGVVSTSSSKVSQFIGCPNPPSGGNSQNNYLSSIQVSGANLIGTGETGVDLMNVIKIELKTNGPLMACFDVYESFFDQFTKNPKGVYTSVAMSAYKSSHGGQDQKEGGHAVTLIGYEQQADLSWNWILINSWGADWADNGYFRIEAGKNLVDIETMCVGAPQLIGGSRKLERNLSTPSDTSACTNNCASLSASKSENKVPGATHNSCSGSSTSVKAAIKQLTTQMKWANNPTFISCTQSVHTGTSYMLELYQCGNEPVCSATVIKYIDGTFSIGSKPSYPPKPFNNQVPWMWVLGCISLVLILVIVQLVFAYVLKKKDVDHSV